MANQKQKNNEIDPSLTAKEEEIMRILWDNGGMFVKEMIDLMPDPKPHVNTVSTFVRQLEAKGMVGHEKHGVSYKYFPILPKDNYRRRTLGRVVKNYFDNNMMSMVSALVEDEKLTVDQLRELINIIENK